MYMKILRRSLFILPMLLLAACNVVKKTDSATSQGQNKLKQSLVVWDSKSFTGGKGWTGKGEDAASIKLAEPDNEGKKLIRYHNKIQGYRYSTFGWQWDESQQAIDLAQYDAVSFNIKITGPQKPQQLFFTVTELNPAPVPLSTYDPLFTDGSWHRITIPVKDMKWRGSSAAVDQSAVKGFELMTFVWDPAEFDIELDHVTFDRGTPNLKLWVSPYTAAIKPPMIPGRIECAFYDEGGEGVAYHDTDPVNILSGILNQQKNHQRPHASSYYWDFRKDEGVDLSYTKDFADFGDRNQFNPPINQLYIGGASNGEWCNYTINVQKAGTYKLTALYGNGVGNLIFTTNDNKDWTCKFPVTTGSAHGWAREEIGTVTFAKAGVQVLKMHYDTGNNLGYLEFVKQ
jgi:hypothetical protein